jgi:hypothetical protein
MSRPEKAVDLVGDVCFSQFVLLVPGSVNGFHAHPTRQVSVAKHHVHVFQVTLDQVLSHVPVTAFDLPACILAMLASLWTRGAACFVACPSGKYKAIAGPSSCLICPDGSGGTIAATQLDQCLCGLGELSVHISPLTYNFDFMLYLPIATLCARCNRQQYG